MKKGKIFILICISSGFIACCASPKTNESIQSANAWMNFELPAINKVKAAKINLELGLEYLKQDQVARAKSKIIRAKELAPHLPEVHYTYGIFQERVGEQKAAEKAYEKAIRLNPNGGNEHNMYAAFLCRQHQYRKAEKEFLRALEDPKFNLASLVYENAGLCVLQIPDIAKATEYFEKALRYDLNRSNALLELAIIKYHANQFSEAKAYYARHEQLAEPTERSFQLAIELAKHFDDQA